ncbi:hypothetical protein FIV42_24025 [Persicimonas caeni]|uniref:Protein kinase domain-containing protein n=1 Tax=Persicimonas caeni TaxID=2292766 RepID=A0A4Y6PZT9_PERCE|nr:serine/threonine-protein kinase [Persicimonas caeni]QDG53699.1 hypothetical protein FIV42_24025 [Persicimonas caeni]QED34920.1 protein kinase [Persicimonas caeni]
MSGRFPEPGKIFEEKYHVEKLLGSGGFARVYLAEQTDLGRHVAIKVLSPKVARAVNAEETDPKIESVALRFEREARVVSQLKSAQTITMYDYGRTESGLLYMVMEYVDGVGLDELEVPIEPRRVIKILKQMLQSLHEAHANGLLHRDLKPANIMVYEHLGEKDQVKLLDFGIAKAVGQAANDDQQDLTASDSLIGTPRYMSPEQIRGQDIGPASDIYSLGLVAYELLMGEKAITNSDSIEILGRHLSSESFEIPRHHAIHPRLRRLINKMLSKNLETRYQETKAVLADLAEIERIDGDLRVGGPPPTPSDDGGEFGDDGELVLDEADIEFEGDSSSSNSRPLIIGAVIVLLLSGVGIAAWQLTGASGTDEKAEPIEIAETPDEANTEEAEPEKARVEKGEEESVVTLIRTRPKGASVWLGDKLVGMAPVQFESTDYEFPLKVIAKMGEKNVEQTLEQPGGEIWLELPEPEELAEKDDPQGEGDEAEKVASGSKATKSRSDDKGGASKGRGGAKERTRTKTTKNEKTSEKKGGQTATVKEKPEPDEKEEEDVDTRKYLPLE